MHPSMDSHLSLSLLPQEPYHGRALPHTRGVVRALRPFDGNLDFDGKHEDGTFRAHFLGHVVDPTQGWDRQRQPSRY
jgi:hypothetical protein